MKILLDPQIYNSQKYGGISKYYTEIFLKLQKNEKIKVIVPLNNGVNHHFNESELVSMEQYAYNFFVKIMAKLRLKYKLNIKSIKNKIVLKKISKQKYDLFIPTYYDSYFINHIGSKPFILTVYDMIHELFPEYFINDNKVVLNKLLLMEKATRIIAVSENTKRDIVKIYPHIDNLKIDVVYHGCSLNINSRKVADLPLKYILFVGNRGIYKNFIFMVNSIEELLKRDEELYLVCAGGGSFDNNEIDFISKLGLDKKIIQRDFKDNELGTYYKMAKCFVFPSLYEGFGIPVLESMACGCPIVLTNNSSFPEVAGNAGVYFELNNSTDLKEKIEKLINDDSMRMEFSLKGLEQVKKFSWDKAVRECLTVYEKALK